MIAGKGRGARKRHFRALPQSQACAAAWATRMHLPAAQGGCTATASSLDEMQFEIDQENRQPRDELEA
eukprot:4065251-Pyramimonas_sp.AAC.1